MDYTVLNKIMWWLKMVVVCNIVLSGYMIVRLCA